MATTVTIVKICIELLLNRKPISLKLGRKYQGDHGTENSENRSDWKSKMTPKVTILKVSLNFFSVTKVPVDLKLGRKYLGDL